MKEQKFKPVLVNRINKRGPGGLAKVSVSPKGGFYVNTTAMKLMGINEPVKVRLYKDQDDSQQWYLNISENGYVTLNYKSDKDKTAQFNAVDLASSLINSFHHIGSKSLKFELLPAIEFEQEKYYPLKVIKESIEMEIPDANGRII